MEKRRGRAAGTVVLFILLALVIGGAAGWALHTLLVTPAPELEDDEVTFVTVQEGEVGSVLNYNVGAEWGREAVTPSPAQGTITEILIDSAEPRDVGDVLYRIDEQPVILAEGSVPAYRTMQINSSGTDVRQLQEFLAHEGFYGGAVDGNMGRQTVSSVKAWQKDLGVPQSGAVEPSDLVFVPHTPASLEFSGDYTVGTQLQGGEQLLHLLSDAPEFTMQLSSGQSADLPSGSRVEMVWNGQPRTAYLAEQQFDELGDLAIISLIGEGEGPVCSDWCHELPVAGRTLIDSQVIIVEPAVGPRVPVSAIGTDEGGQTYVQLADGSREDIEIITASRGMAIIEGVDIGTDIVIPVGQ